MAVGLVHCILGLARLGGLKWVLDVRGHGFILLGLWCSVLERENPLYCTLERDFYIMSLSVVYVFVFMFFINPKLIYIYIYCHCSAINSQV